MTEKEEYFEFLKTNFDGLQIAQGLFYNWKIGLRFDLQVGRTDTDEYFVEVNKRATTLFEMIFDPADSLYLVFMDFKYRRRKIRISNYCFRQISQLNKTEIHYTKVRQLYEPNDKFDIRNVAIIKLRTERVNFRKILAAIGNTDFPPRQPRLERNSIFTSKEVYFINTTKKIIFNMYDDRGLDILAVDREVLRPLYEKHKDWLLDYDMVEMKKRMS